MSLDVYIIESGYSANITHNLGKMADAAGIYCALWRPDEIGCKFAKDIIQIVEGGLINLILNPSKYREYNPSNGWGSYDGFVVWVANYLEALKQTPESEIEVSR